jgi:putative membrane protein insertion efficiency factor
MTNFVPTLKTPLSAAKPLKNSLFSRFLSRGIHAYQHLNAGKASPCRFIPTCSNYALEAIETHGALKGSGLSLRRIGRCRPGGAHGVDPVPTKKESNN